MKNIGYARVSTKGQAKNGNSLEEQEQALKSAGCTIIFKDAFTGKKTERPEFKKALEALESGDTFVVTKLDRFARSLRQGNELVETLISKGVKVNIMNIGVMDNTPASKLIRSIFFAFAEFERDMIMERTQEGKAIAKTKEGFKEGRPKKYTPQIIEYALSLLADNTYKAVEEKTKISVSTLKRAYKAKERQMIQKNK